MHHKARIATIKGVHGLHRHLRLVALTIIRFRGYCSQSRNSVMMIVWTGGVRAVLSAFAGVVGAERCAVSQTFTPFRGTAAQISICWTVVVIFRLCTLVVGCMPLPHTHSCVKGDVVMYSVTTGGVLLVGACKSMLPRRVCLPVVWHVAELISHQVLSRFAGYALFHVLGGLYWGVD